MFDSPLPTPAPTDQPGGGDCTYPDDPGGDARAISYEYDPLGRLVEAAYSTGECFQYTYDAVGNRTAMSDPSGDHTYTYDAASQLATAHASDSGTTWYYSHDQRGNLVRQTPGGTEPAEGEIRYSYNGAGQLVRVELYMGGTYVTLAEGAYDVDGERVQLTTWAEGIPLTTTYGVYQHELLLADDGALGTLYLRRPRGTLGGSLYGMQAAGQSLIAEYEGQWAYHLRDGLDSVRQMADEKGAITLMRAYKPFGGILEEEGRYETAFGYLGAQIDHVSGLLYAGGRYYDPATGRFLTPKRAVDPHKPRMLNPYAPWQNPALWLMGPLVVFSAFKGGRKRRKHGYWVLLLLVGMGTSVILTGCEEELPPLEDTEILDVPWVDEMDQDTWNQYPNSCGAMALYMFLQAEGMSVDLATLVQQLREERPGGYDGYCCSEGWGRFPTPTPDPLGWCNNACVSAEALADVARKHYGMAIESGDHWTRERVHQKLLDGHPVLALIRTDLRTRPVEEPGGAFGHFVVIRGLVDQGRTVVFNDSYPAEQGWYWTAEQRRAAGEAREASWRKFDASWASAVDKGKDPLAPHGHVRWAMAAQ